MNYSQKNDGSSNEQILKPLTPLTLQKPLIPLELFPNGRYYNLNSNTLENNNNDDKKPYMIHFNWLNGHKKKNFMKKYNKWYI